VKNLHSESTKTEKITMTNGRQIFLKITSILMIAGGIIAGIAGVIAILGVSALAALAGECRWNGSPLREFHHRDNQLGD